MHRSLLLPRNLDEAGAQPRSALLAKGFRPFFLLAGAFAVVIVPLWLVVLHGAVRTSAYLAPSSLHAHEMLFGFAVAVLAGFLLTAVGNWTQRETAVGLPLFGLAALWLAGRGVMLASQLLPRALTAATELAFLPTLAVVLARPLIAAKSRRNLGLLAIIAALFAADVAVHLEANGLLESGAAQRACGIAVDLVLLVILIIAGRVFPMFTRNATSVTSIRSIPWLDQATIVAMVLSTAFDAWAPDARATALLFGGTGVLAALRSIHWGAWYSFGKPLLWSLHAGYAWLCAGLLFRVFAFAGFGTHSLATHALTVGAIGGLTLAMMARVALGHTGRLLAASPGMTWAFLAINAAAALRCLGPLLLPDHYLGLLVLAGSLWTIAFVVFLVVYTPILLRVRVDNRPG